MKRQTVEEFLAAGGEINVYPRPKSIKSQTDKPPKKKPKAVKRTKKQRKKLQKKPRSVRREEYQKFLKSEEWAKIRADVIMLAEYKCEMCGFRPKVFQVHHLNYDKPWGQEEPGDLACLCGRCHDKEHGKPRRRRKKKKRRKPVR
jgi:5-methylcytosine-specific restriction endonuclease McrA